MNLGEQEEVSKHFERLWRQGIAPWLSHKKEPLLKDFFTLIKKEFRHAKLLDIGCGNGWISILAANERHEAYGIDVSKEAIDSAILKSKSLELSGRAHFQVGDALNLPYEDNFFDALVDRGLFHHILPKNRKLYLKSILRVLKPESLIYLSVFSEKNPSGIGQRFTKEKINEIFGQNFIIAKFQEDPYPTQNPAHLLHVILDRK